MACVRWAPSGAREEVLTTARELLSTLGPGSLDFEKDEGPSSESTRLSLDELVPPHSAALLRRRWLLPRAFPFLPVPL